MELAVIETYTCEERRQRVKVMIILLLLLVANQIFEVSEKKRS